MYEKNIKRKVKRGNPFKKGDKVIVKSLHHGHFENIDEKWNCFINSGGKNNIDSIYYNKIFIVIDIGTSNIAIKLPDGKIIYGHYAFFDSANNLEPLTVKDFKSQKCQ